MRVAIIYIPGLGDGYDGVRQLALRRWKSQSVTPYFVAMKWSCRTETFESKYQRILKVVQQAKRANDTIVLVGESAGGAMALYTLRQAANEIDQVVTMCGYNHGAPGLSPHHKLMHPAFYTLMPQVDDIVESLTDSERSKITTLYSQHDRTVTPPHTLIAGTKAAAIGVRGHIISIAWMLATKFPLRAIR